MKDCKLIEDLLPLYLEDMLGETARNFVEDHLKKCISCKQLVDGLSTEKLSISEVSLPSSDKEKSVGKIVKSYKKWFYSIIFVAILCSLLGGIAGTYILMKYEELVPNHVAQDFVKYGLKGDRWVYQERVAESLKSQLNFEKYSTIRTWEEVESYTKKIQPAGFKVFKNIHAQEYGPIDVSLKIGLVLEKSGFRVFKVSINDKADYQKKKAALEKALIDKNSLGKNNAIKDLDKQYIDIPPANPEIGEYFVEGRILKIVDDKIFIEQHTDTHSVPIESFIVAKETTLARYHIVKENDYYRKIKLKDLKVGDVIFIIFNKENMPRVVAVN